MISVEHTRIKREISTLSKVPRCGCGYCGNSRALAMEGACKTEETKDEPETAECPQKTVDRFLDEVDSELGMPIVETCPAGNLSASKSSIIFVNSKQCDKQGTTDTTSDRSDSTSNRGLTTPGERRGRFIIESSDHNTIVSTMQFQRGRFHVTQAISPDEVEGNETRRILRIIAIQNKQIDILFDMMRNMSGEDRLFHKEFIALSNNAYEQIECLRKIMKG